MTASTPYNTTTANSGNILNPYQDGTTLDNCTIGGVTPAPATVTNLIVTGSSQSAAPIVCNAASLVLTAAAHAGRLIIQTLATGTAFTLPPATGTGNTYKILIKTTPSGGSTTISTASLDVDVFGTCMIASYVTDDNAQTAGLYCSTATMNTVTINGTTTGISGTVITMTDVATALWAGTVIGSTTGDDATPFSDV